jgi:DNA polymerase I-like protein with 3'-5' exonuclease and polymerase domains
MMGAATMVENAGAQNLINAAPSLGIQIAITDTPSPYEVTVTKFAASLLDSYHKPFPRIREWYGEVKQEISSTSKLVSPLGWTRHFFGDISKNHNMLRGAVAHGPQNLSVSILNIGLWKVWQYQKKNPITFRLKAQIHDSILFQYKKDKPEIKKEIKQLLYTPTIIHGRTLVIPTDSKSGHSWATMEKD